jgi:hypothetical protein
MPAVGLVLASAVAVHAQPPEINVVLDGTETYTTTFVDPDTGIPVIVNREFHGLEEIYVNDEGDVLLSGTLDRGPGSDLRIDSLFFSPAQDQSGRPSKLWDDIDGPGTPGGAHSPNSAASFLFENDGSYFQNTNGGNRIELGQNLESGSPTYTVVAADDVQPTPPISSIGTPLVADRANAIIVNNLSDGEVLYRVNSFTDDAAFELRGALYRRNAAGDVERIVGAGDSTTLDTGEAYQYKDAPFLVNDAGYGLIRDGASFLTRKPNGTVGRVFSVGETEPETGLIFGDIDTDETSFDIDNQGRIVFSNVTDNGDGNFAAGVFTATAGQTGSVEAVMVTGDTTPGGLNVGTLDIASDGETDPKFIGTKGDFIFTATSLSNNKPSEIVRYNNTSGQLETFLSDGDPIGTDGLTASLNFESLGQFDVNQLGQFAMITEVLDGDGNELEALIAYDPTLGFLPIAVEGETLIADGVSVEVDGFQEPFSQNRNGAFGLGFESGFLSNGGWLAFGVETDDELYFAFRTQIPEPASLALLGLGGLALLGGRRRR